MDLFDSFVSSSSRERSVTEKKRNIEKQFNREIQLTMTEMTSLVSQYDKFCDSKSRRMFLP